MQATNTAVPAQGDYARAETLNTHRRIGSTVYEIEVYVKKSTGETIDEKIARLVKNDLNLAPRHGSLCLPQTNRLPESEVA
jgi:hypothetical protein